MHIEHETPLRNLTLLRSACSCCLTFCLCRNLLWASRFTSNFLVSETGPLSLVDQRPLDCLSREPFRSLPGLPEDELPSGFCALAESGSPVECCSCTDIVAEGSRNRSLTKSRGVVDAGTKKSEGCWGWNSLSISTEYSNDGKFTPIKSEVGGFMLVSRILQHGAEVPLKDRNCYSLA